MKGDKIATREAYGKTLVELGALHPDMVVMDADLAGSTKTAEFRKVYPERFFNMGIAEQNLMGTAAGIALSGHLVFASSFAMFAAGRAFEIIRNAIGYTGANVKVCATHAGLTVGEDGASHQAIEDVALMRTIPGMTVVNPADAVSCAALLRQVADLQGPAYVRLGRAKVPVLYDEEEEIHLGKGHVLRPGKDVTVIASGIMVAESLQAASQLEKEGIDVRLIDLHTIKPLDREIIVRAAKETGRIVTAEEHSVIGGLGDAVASVLCEACPVRLKKVGVEDCFGESGKPEELKEKYGLTAAHVAACVREICA